MAIWITLGALLLLGAALAVVLSRRGAHGPDGDDTWRDAGFQPGSHATNPYPHDHGF